jgi:hypothetical protein
MNMFISMLTLLQHFILKYLYNYFICSSAMKNKVIYHFFLLSSITGQAKGKYTLNS